MPLDSRRRRLALESLQRHLLYTRPRPGCWVHLYLPGTSRASSSSWHRTLYLVRDEGVVTGSLSARPVEQTGEAGGQQKGTAPKGACQTLPSKTTSRNPGGGPKGARPLPPSLPWSCSDSAQEPMTQKLWRLGPASCWPHVDPSCGSEWPGLRSLVLQDGCRH